MSALRKSWTNYSCNDQLSANYKLTKLHIHESPTCDISMNSSHYLEFWNDLSKCNKVTVRKLLSICLIWQLQIDINNHWCTWVQTTWDVNNGINIYRTHWAPCRDIVVHTETQCLLALLQTCQTVRLCGIHQGQGQHLRIWLTFWSAVKLWRDIGFWNMRIFVTVQDQTNVMFQLRCSVLVFQHCIRPMTSEFPDKFLVNTLWIQSHWACCTEAVVCPFSLQLSQVSEFWRNLLQHI